MPFVFIIFSLIVYVIALVLYFAPWSHRLDKRRLELDARRRAIAMREATK